MHFLRKIVVALDTIKQKHLEKLRFVKVILPNFSKFTQDLSIRPLILNLEATLLTKSIDSCVSLDTEAFKPIHKINTVEQVAKR
ncbi:hypothetical protein H6G17_16460 [Chroococcidiopsis sp. FACHB-1243]|uniref:hypothetical protein n=1 Tax=Chroococcidiopsis sp. [FACHB-1243] TaxID=2692781 RepID=UPI0017816111|nr:hypothetical protein [Chroococcidiopsis sp. [FACHB-1243]]MBD2307095.1 hypothetical protein [Chroococcidiopsis sp. [FACHB-1243]]